MDTSIPREAPRPNTRRRRIRPLTTQRDVPQAGHGQRVGQIAQASHADVERPVLRVARALAVVPSLGPGKKVWRRLGFHLTDAFAFSGCPAFDLVLAGNGVRFLVPPRHAVGQQRLADAITELLERGSGLLGWSWACQSVYRARSLLQRSVADFETAAEGRTGIVVPRDLTPGATTLLEPLLHEELPPHENGATHLARILLTVAQPDAAADVYEHVFGFRSQRETRGTRRFAEIQVGNIAGLKLDLVGPAESEGASRAGHPWGLVFDSKDLDATVRFFRATGVEIGDALDAPEGGRVAALPRQIGGISIAFTGK